MRFPLIHAAVSHRHPLYAFKELSDLGRPGVSEISPKPVLSIIAAPRAPRAEQESFTMAFPIGMIGQDPAEHPARAHDLPSTNLAS
jgi:hypothetical protein